MVLIIYGILDKFVDIATAVEYHKGKLFLKAKDSVYRALLAFTIIGGIISLFRISLYVWRIYLNCSSEESCDKRYDDFDMGIRGGYWIYPWVGRCGSAPHTLTLFKRKIADFPTLFKTEFRFLIPSLRHS